MAVRVLVGVVAALRAVLVPGEAHLMTTRPVSIPRVRLSLRRPYRHRLPHATRAGASPLAGHSAG